MSFNVINNSKFCLNKMQIIVAFVLISLTIFSWSCKKPSTDNFSEPKYTSEDTLSVVWFRPFYADSAQSYFMSNPYLISNYALFCTFLPIEDGNKNGFQVYDKSTGKKHSNWNVEPEFTFEKLQRASDWFVVGENYNLVIVTDGLSIACFDIMLGLERWNHRINNLNYRFGVFGDAVYATTDTETKAEIIKINLESGQQNIIFTKYTENGYEQSFESILGWVSPSGDSVLVFQARQHNFSLFKGKVDVLAYNMSSDSLLWTVEDITFDGNSSVKKSSIANNKLYFQGMQSQHCIDLLTGEVVWTVNYISQNVGFFEADNLYVDGKLFARSQESIFAYDANSGNEIWRIDDLYGSESGKMDFYKGNLYFTAVDYKSDIWYQRKIICLNANTGELVWKSAVMQGDYTFSWFKEGVVIDQSTGYLYTNDSKNIVCVDLDKTLLLNAR